MNRTTKISMLLVALLGTTSAMTVAAREAGEVRGEGKGHPAIEVKDVLAREAGEVRGESKGHPVVETTEVTA